MMYRGGATRRQPTQGRYGNDGCRFESLHVHHPEQTRRDHATIEQVIAELKDGPLAHAPSGKFTANAAWLTVACIAFNVLRAAGAAWHAKARWATLRTQLITVPARIASTARRLVLHLPKD